MKTDMSDKWGRAGPPGDEASAWRQPLRSTEWWGLFAGCVVALAVVVPVEVSRLRNAPLSGLAAWIATFNIDTSPFAPWLLVGLVLLWRRRRRRDDRAATDEVIDHGDAAARSAEACPPERSAEARGGSAKRIRRVTLGAAAVAGVSLACALYVAARPVGHEGRPFGSLPPAYHDEYSYLFQARTFLAGRWWFPSAPRHRELFDQMHVLNEGRFASRYFPGTGLWLAPWVAAGHPVWGQYVAGMLASVFVFLAARELGGDAFGLVSGLLFASAPGVALFGNLLLAHHPTLLGLTLFLWAFARMLRGGGWRWAFWAGCGLSWAMLCRPLTAAAFGLPFGIRFFGQGWRTLLGHKIRARTTAPQAVAAHDQTQTAATSAPAASSPDHPGRPRAFDVQTGWTPADWWRCTLGLAIPLAVGFVVLAIQNRAITGSVWVTPYQRYTELYTPRHVYGFYNVSRGEKRLGPRVLDNYDRWAEELTPERAVRNLVHRWLASWQWSFGVVPLTVAGVLVLFVLVARTIDGGLRNGLWLLVGSIAALHAAHVPYWFSGILHYHYVFETLIAWSIIIGFVTLRLCSTGRRQRRWGIPVWWSAALVLLFATQYVAVEPLWPVSRVDAAVQEIGFSRLKYARFRELIERSVRKRPALVLVVADPSDRHIDFVSNSPGLDEEVLFGRWSAGAPDQRRWLAEIRRTFPDRHIYVFDARRWQLTEVATAIGSPQGR